jgi:DNA repair protein RadD
MAQMTNFEDRQYQTEAADAGASFLLDDRQKNGIIVLPTGSGKSRVLAMVAQRLNAPLLVFQPSKEILEQNLEKFRHYGYEPGVYSASMNRRSVGEITLATIGSVAGAKGEKIQRESKAHLFTEFPYIIVDECHEVSAKKGGYKSFFDEVPARLLGLTATPFRMASNSYGTEMRWLTRTKPRVFSEVVYYAQIRDLMDEGYLMKPEYQIVKGFNRNKVQPNSKGSDYTDSSVQKHLFEIGFDQRLEEVTRRLIHKVGRKHILVFTRFVQDAENLVKAVEGGAVVSDKTPKRERERILRDFKSGVLRYVANVKVLDTGFDFPELDTVVDAGPTLSLRRHMQKLGRLVRPHPEKSDAWHVDMVDGIAKFGKLEDMVIHEDPWCIRSGDKQLTNAPLTEGGKQKCNRCGSSLWFWARHSGTGNANRISRPVNGTLPNINIRREGGKTLYDVVTPGQGEFVSHAAVCTGRVRN